MRFSSRSLLVGALLSLVARSGQIDAQEAPFIGVRVDQDRNKVLLEIPADRFGKDFLHQSVLATGAGVSALGLDRGQTGGSDVVRLERRGKRVARAGQLERPCTSRRFGRPARGEPSVRNVRHGVVSDRVGEWRNGRR